MGMMKGLLAEGGIGISKPSSRLQRKYRVMWNDDGGAVHFYHPPLSPEKFAQVHMGYFDGSPVDAYLCALGACAGYVVNYPTRVEGIGFIVDRLRQAGNIGSLVLWRHAQTIRHLWETGHDPFEILHQEARRLGIDFWFQLRMNDWHHWAGIGQSGAKLPGGLNLMSSSFYEDHPEYLIGLDGVAGLESESLRARMRWYQDYAHPEVRQVRLDLMEEACTRYDVDGFEYDFMRCPGYFKVGKEEANAPLMTGFIRQTRAILDRIGAERGKQIGLSVRVPDTIAAAKGLGLDVARWIEEELVDVVVPSCFFNADLSQDINEWVELAAGNPTWIYPGIEEAYRAGYLDRVDIEFVQPPARLLLSDEMINAVAANHWANGADGLYVFNWCNKTWEGNRLPLDNMADPLRLKYKDKLYALTRSDGQYILPGMIAGQVPATLGTEPVAMKMAIADDLDEAGARAKSCRLYVQFSNLTIEDSVEVRFNGEIVEPVNPFTPEKLASSQWQIYDLANREVQTGYNEISFHVIERNVPPQLAEELPIGVSDVELDVKYHFPNGPGEQPPGFAPRT